MEHEAAETVPATPGASDGRDTNQSSQGDEPDDESVVGGRSTADSMSLPDMEDLRRREVQLARKRQVMSLEALEEGVKMQRLILQELQGLRCDLKEFQSALSSKGCSPDIVQKPQLFGGPS